MLKYGEIIELALREDLGTLRDITSRSIFSKESISKAIIIAKEAGIIVGMDVVREVFHYINSDLRVDAFAEDGDYVTAQTELFVIEGSTISILEGERVALNILGHLSGIATTVKEYVKIIEGTGVKILDTRKTLPGLRALEKYAVLMGGGINHRMGLYDMILIKDNHIEAVGGITNAVNKVRESYSNDFFIEVEVRNIKEVDDAMKCSVDRILLDNMSLDAMREAVKLVNGKISLEASGNVNIKNVRDIAETGVNFISIGAITLSSRALDVSLKIIK
ncbi:MAG: carboxylating nicotinate-nucleotide diphosphorylase [Spirochaetota bacterium]|nr:carboxylating nicotinate-nucleotide diphosphorylase [Spirochaetota bacterium]